MYPWLSSSVSGLARVANLSVQSSDKVTTLLPAVYRRAAMLVCTADHAAFQAVFDREWPRVGLSRDDSLRDQSGTGTSKVLSVTETMQ